MSVVSNLIYSFQGGIPAQISASYVVNMNKLILKFIWKGKRLKIAITVEKEEKTCTDTTQLQLLL